MSSSNGAHYSDALCTNASNIWAGCFPSSVEVFLCSRSHPPLHPLSPGCYQPSMALGGSSHGTPPQHGTMLSMKLSTIGSTFSRVPSHLPSSGRSSVSRPSLPSLDNNLAAQHRHCAFTVLPSLNSPQNMSPTVYHKLRKRACHPKCASAASISILASALDHAKARLHVHWLRLTE
jgi:hypothetical protein